MKTINRIKAGLKRFHNNEEGLEALQVVMIIAIASLFLIAVKFQWQTIETWYKGLVEAITGWQPTDTA